MKHEHTFALASLIHVFLVKIGPGDQVSWARSTSKLPPFPLGPHFVIFPFLFESEKVASEQPPGWFIHTN